MRHNEKTAQKRNLEKVQALKRNEKQELCGMIRKKPLPVLAY